MKCPRCQKKLSKLDNQREDEIMYECRDCLELFTYGQIKSIENLRKEQDEK